MLSKTVVRSLAVVGAARVAVAQTSSPNISANVCVDPTAFTTCITNAQTSAKGCMDTCNGGKVCVLACGCAMYQSFMNCVAESCWNQAYSCEYDELVAEYFAQCPVATEPIPFWPAPDDAPYGCSCNLGKIEQSTNKAQFDFAACIKNDSATSVMDLSNKDTACGCCEVSAGLSAMYETCPDTIPHEMGADLWLQSSTVYGQVIHWDQCGPYLDQYSCPDLGFHPPSSKSNTFYKPNNLPPNGTQTLYNTNVATAIKSPPSGSVFTWSQTSVTYTVTASPWKNSGVQATGTGAAGAAGASGASGASGTAAATGAAKTGASVSLKQPSSAIWLSVLGALARMML